jgi:hypothetical protein
MLSIILPTITGREDSYRECRAAYSATLDVEYEVVTPLDYMTVGEAWNAGALQASGDTFLFAIDDAVPQPGWYDAGMLCVKRGVLPSPTLWFADGSLEGAGTMGFGGFLPLAADGVECRSAGLVFVDAKAWRRTGPFLPIHYYSDDEWSWRWRKQGWLVQVCHGFAFAHGHNPVGRQEMQARAMRDREAFLRAAAGLDPFPS